MVHLVDEVEPWLHVRLSLERHAHLAEHDFVEVLGMHSQGYLVDRVHILRLHHRFGRYIAEKRYFAAHVVGNFLFGAEHEHVGLYAEFLK